MKCTQHFTPPRVPQNPLNSTRVPDDKYLSSVTENRRGDRVSIGVCIRVTRARTEQVVTYANRVYAARK